MYDLNFAVYLIQTDTTSIRGLIYIYGKSSCLSFAMKVAWKTIFLCSVSFMHISVHYEYFDFSIIGYKRDRDLCII